VHQKRDEVMLQGGGARPLENANTPKDCFMLLCVVTARSDTVPVPRFTGGGWEEGVNRAAKASPGTCRKGPFVWAGVPPSRWEDARTVDVPPDLRWGHRTHEKGSVSRESEGCRSFLLHRCAE
jgi:hypothetical protein